jgi:hypothetical protein
MSKTFIRTVCCAVALAALLPLGTFAQRKTASRENALARRPSIDLTADVPAASELVFFVNLYDRGRPTVRIESFGASSGNGTSALKRILDRFPATSAGTSTTVKDLIEPLIVVNASPALTFQQIFEYLDPLRQYGPNKIKITTGTSQHLIVPARSPKGLEPRPSPLTLKILIRKDLAVELNGEPWGTTADLSGLVNRLKGIFSARTEMGVFRDGTEEVETTIHIQPESSIVFWEILKVELASRTAGSDRVFLVFDKDDAPKLPSVPVRIPKSIRRL